MEKITFTSNRYRDCRRFAKLLENLVKEAGCPVERHERGDQIVVSFFDHEILFLPLIRTVLPWANDIKEAQDYWVKYPPKR